MIIYIYKRIIYENFGTPGQGKRKCKNGDCHIQESGKVSKGKQ